MPLTDAMHEPLLYAIPAFVAFMVLEIVSLRVLADDAPDRYRGYEFRDARASILMGLGSLVVNGTARVGALIGYTALFALTPLRLDAHRWYTWLLTLLAVDLIWYCYHRASHRVRLMWAGHQAHHNSVYFNLSTAVRQKWNPWFELVFWVPLPLLGVPPWLIFTAFSVNLIFQFFVHTERIGRLPRAVEFVFNTPSHHRVHHASDPDYLDRNYAGILIVWDRLFGTFQPEVQRPTYGLTHPVGTYHLLRLQYGDYVALWRDVRAASRWRDRLGYLFRPPGWSPDRSAHPSTGPSADPPPAPSSCRPGSSRS